MRLVVSIYAASQSFPKHEIYGLSSQMRRAAISIPSNVAEGKGRSTDRDRAHFFSQARGSLLELETQVLIAQELHYLKPDETQGILNLSKQTGQMLNALIKSIRPKDNSGPAR